jgi:hypothetical protein
MFAGKTVSDWISLLVPAMFVLCGISVIVIALIGSPKQYENCRNLQIQEHLSRWGKAKLRIAHALIGAAMTALGGWLIYCWAFGPVQR